MPILDLKVSLGQDGTIYHQFYEKPTKNPRVIAANSALSFHSKKNIMVQECIRRLRNINTGIQDQNDTLSIFMERLKKSGYPQKFRQEVVLRAKRAYKKMVEADQKGECPLYRDRQTLAELKQAKAKLGKWFNQGKIKYSSVLFIPATPGGVLAAAMRKREAELNKNSGFRVKIIEKGGRKLKDILVNKNPFPDKPCEELYCPLCTKTAYTDPPIKPSQIRCDTLNVGYRWTCTACKMVYEGETGRNLRIRSKEHLKDLAKHKPDGPMVKHIDEKHAGQKVKFEVAITSKFYDALSRQANEGVRIENHRNNIMNTKAEFNHPKINRLKLD